MAVTAGIDTCRGDAAIIMDSDLQDPPKVSLELIKTWEKGYDVVYAQRRSRKDSFFKKFTANIFYRLLHHLAEIDIPRNTGDFRLIDRQVINELKKYKEHDRFLRGLISSLGFKQIGVLFDRDERHAGKSGYSMKKMVKLALDGIYGFSTCPIRLVSIIGCGMLFLGLVGLIIFFSMRLFWVKISVGIIALLLITIMFLFNGLIFIVLGILGEYIGRIYTEAKQRPLYSIRSINGKKI